MVIHLLDLSSKGTKTLCGKQTKPDGSIKVKAIGQHATCKSCLRKRACAERTQAMKEDIRNKF